MGALSFFCEHSTGNQQIFPIYQSIEIDGGLDENLLFFKTEIQTDFKLSGDDYVYFSDINSDVFSRCENVIIRIFRNGQQIIQGEISFDDCKFDDVNCLIDATMMINDPINCMVEKWETDFNVLDIANPGISVSSAIGDVEIGVVSSGQLTNYPNPNDYGQTDHPQFPFAENWRIFRIACFFIPNQNNPHYIITTWYIREKLISPYPPNLDEWIVIVPNAEFGREIPITSEETTIFPIPTGGIVGGCRWLKEWGTPNFSFNEFDSSGQTEIIFNRYIYSNGRTLESVFQSLADELNCGLSIKSKFFQINDSISDSDNSVYQDARNYGELVIWQKSDVVRPDVSNDATIGEMNLYDLINNICRLFNLFIQVSNSEIIIEHKSLYTTNQGVDLETYVSNINQFDEFEYSSNRVSEIERYYWADVQSPYFTGNAIKNDCNNGKETKTNIEIFSSDFGFINANPDLIDDSNFAIAEIETFNGAEYLRIYDDRLNGRLAFTNIHDWFFHYYRMFPTGEINGNPVTFQTYQFRKNQKEFLFPLSYDDFELIDWADAMKSGLGWGVPKSYKYNIVDCVISISLKHDY